jgi:hypothetical protein
MADHRNHFNLIISINSYVELWAIEKESADKVVTRQRTFGPKDVLEKINSSGVCVKNAQWDNDTSMNILDWRILNDPIRTIYKDNSPVYTHGRFLDTLGPQRQPLKSHIRALLENQLMPVTDTSMHRLYWAECKFNIRGIYI